MVLVAVAIATLVVAEPLMTLVHRFVFHGPLWCEHESHHAHPTVRGIVRNDLLWVWPLLASAALVVFGSPALAGLGIGGALYVGAYIFAHDGVAHGRFPLPRWVRRMTVFRIIGQTHRLHHRTCVGAPPFGVYLAPLERRWRLLVHYTPPTKVCDPPVTPFVP
jgi:beta-carotene 3-hydroxylase